MSVTPSNDLLSNEVHECSSMYIDLLAHSRRRRQVLTISARSFLDCEYPDSITAMAII